MKREPVDNEREQDAWLGNTLRQTTATAPDGCLDAETLAAWADAGLNAQAAAAVELHASNCSRCMAVLATLERTAPVAPVADAWTLARVFRWVAPLAAAATAVAIWVAVPDRSITPVESTVSQDVRSIDAVPVPVPGSGSAAEPGSLNQNRAPATGNAAPGTRNPEPQSKSEFRDELRRQSGPGQAVGSVAAPAASAERYAPEREMGAPAAGPVAADEQLAAPPAAAPPPPAPRAFAADARTENATAGTAQRSALSSATVLTSESSDPRNSLIRWRILANTLLERSKDGGKSWTRATGPAPNLAAVRAVDADRAVVTTSDKAEFYTTNGGQSWTRVQENSAAPF